MLLAEEDIGCPSENETLSRRPTGSMLGCARGAQVERRVVRSIGDPNVRFVEDPVRMLRAAVMTARLGFDLDPLVSEAIAEHRALIATASAARLLEEYFKILRSGSAESTFGALGRLRLLELMTPELRNPPDAVWDALARLDRYRSKFPSAPAALTNALLIGSLLQPLGMLAPAVGTGRAREPHADRVSFGMLPVARRDVERLRQVVDLAPRLVAPEISPRAARSLPHRPAFPDALTWLDVHGDAPDVVESWRQAHRHRSAAQAPPTGDQPQPSADEHNPAGTGRRRRRRRRRRGRGPQPGPGTGTA
jgi:poly(A) polymerase